METVDIDKIPEVQRADELQKKLFEDETEPKEMAENTSPEAPAVESGTEPADQQSGTASETSEDSATVAEETEPAAKIQAEPTEPDYKHKYDVLQGKYNAEIGRLTTRLAQLEAQTATASKTESDTASKPAVPADLDQAIGEIAESYGVEPELIKKIVNLTGQTAKFEIEPIRQSVERQQQSAAQRAQDEFYTRLDAKAPQWEAVYGSPEFKAFAGQVGEDLIAAHAARLDDAWIAQFFKHFEQTKNPPATPPPKPAATNAQVSAAAQAVPRSSPSMSEQASKRTYSAQQYRDGMNKIYSGTMDPKDEKTLNDELSDAMLNGRVIGL